MINLSEQRVIEDTFFKANMSYYKPSLYFHFANYFHEEQEYTENTDIKLKHFLKGDKNMAFNKVLKKDLKLMLKEIKTTPKQFDENLWKGMLPKIRTEIKKTLGLAFKPRLLFFEDSFPHGLMSFEKKGASSVTIFEGQDDAGVYFLNKRVSSFFTPILMIHEQIHSCLSQNKTKDQMYIEWFEEGLAQWFSLLIYYNITKNMEVIKLYKERCYIFSKVKSEHNFTRRYFEYMKIMSKLYLSGGPELLGKMLMKYMSNDRKKVNSYLNYDKGIKYVPKKDIENFLVNFTDVYEPEKLPPIEYLILKESVKPKTVEEISKKTKAPVELIQKAGFALRFKGMIIVTQDNKIEINWRKKDLLEKDLIKPFWPLKK
ncbi:hypothetical protein HOD20_02330 [archaeon]|jgi:hypothetical protein|nr:hypothetical protein [archaeon]MBT4648059.1 hypothetical protein [archaeon]MBT6822687.1 hypothetical protein [archaeon]MBT7392430.1 hypothetical protein [archaeon]